MNKMPELEASLIFIMSMLTYATCELPGLNLAAIVAIFVFGIMQSHYNRWNLSEEAVDKAGFTFGLLSYLCEALILIYFGLSFDRFFDSFKREILWYALIDFAILLTLRFTVVFGLLGVVRLIKGRPLSLSWIEATLVSFSGMIRGSIAYALVVKLAPDDVEAKKLGESKKLPEIVCIAQLVIAFTMYIFTPLNPFLFKKLLSSKNQSGEGSMVERPHSRTVLLQNREKLVNKSDTTFKTLFKRLDEFFLKPIFIREYEDRVVGQSHSSSRSGERRRRSSTPQKKKLWCKRRGRRPTTGSASETPSGLRPAQSLSTR